MRRIVFSVFFFVAVFGISADLFATTDVAVYEASKQGRGVSVATYDPSGRIVDEQTVLAGEQVVGVQAGQPVPPRQSLTPNELEDGRRDAEKLTEQSKLDEIRRMIREAQQNL